MPIQVVTIDFWNTLFTTAESEQRERHRLAVVQQQLTRLGKAVDEQALREAQRQTWLRFKQIWKQEHRTPSTEELVAFFFRSLGVEPDVEAIETVTYAFAYGILEHPPSLLPGAAVVLPRLLRQGLRLALISDTAFSPGTVLRQVMKNVGIDEWFSAYSFSDQTGVAKPHPDAYLYALQQLDAAPTAAVHIGDIERTDIVGAKALGMWAVLFRGDHNPILNDERQETTQADRVVFHWEEVPEALEYIKRSVSR